MFLRPKPADDTREDGFTLVEVAFAVLILGTVFVAILGAVSAMISAGVQNRNAGVAEVAAHNAAEAVKDPALIYKVACADYKCPDVAPGKSSCADAVSVYKVAAQLAVAPATVTEVKVEVLKRGTPPATEYVDCDEAPGDKGFQRVTLKVTSPEDSLSGTFTRRVMVVKRNPAP